MPMSDSDMARLRAEMLLRAEQPVYDDGASLLGQDPYMQQVGLFGRGPKPTKPVAPVNPSRRSLFGLPEAPPAQPLVPVTPTSPVAQPQTTTPPPIAAPQPAAQPQPANPLGQLAAKALSAPVTRRQVLQRAGAAAVQNALPMPKATDIVKEVVSPLAEAAVVQPFDPLAAANAIANYVAGVYNDPDAAALAYTSATGLRPSDSLGDPSDLTSSAFWSALEDGDANLSAAAKATGLDPETIAKQTGVPLHEVIKIVGENGETGVNELMDAANTVYSHEQILSDGRPKEARRSTYYIDIWNDKKFLKNTAKQLLKEYGKDADGYDLYDAFNDALFERWKSMERGNTVWEPSKSPYVEHATHEGALRNALRDRVVDDDTLGEVWGQASDDDDMYETVMDIFLKNGWQGGD